MRTFAAFRKQRTLRRISRALGSRHDPAAFLVDLVSSEPSPRHQAMEDLFDLCESQHDLANLLRSRGAGRAQLQEIYECLLSAGAGQWLAGHYVPVSALCTASTLDFLLSRAGVISWPEIAICLMDYFERNETGPVR